MFTVTSRHRHQSDPVKGSRFITTAAPVTSEDEARQVVSEVAAEMPDASHHCTAWRIASPTIDRCNDDGEPGGSAGRPILAQLVGRDLVNVIVVVTRYFGGTKLGVGGLVRAYGGAAGAALDELTTEPYRATSPIAVIVNYSDAERVQRAFHAAGWDVDDASYDDVVTLSGSIPEVEVEDLIGMVADVTSGRGQVLTEPM